MKKNKIASIIISISAVSAILSSYTAYGKEYCETLSYAVRDNKAVITGYSGNPEKLVIPQKIDGKDVVGIRENAFYKCESIKEISLPKTVTYIGHHAFFECTALEKAILSDNICSIGEGAFSGCISLKETKLPENLSIIESNGFYNCVSLEKIDFPYSVNEIGNYAFAHCRSMEEAALKEGILTIGDYAFSDCELLERIYIPESVVNIGMQSFGFNSRTQNNNHFTIYGTEASLGKLYAENNNIKFKLIGQRHEKRKVSVLPAAAMIFSGAGLLFIKSFSSIKKFKRKYRYEY